MTPQAVELHMILILIIVILFFFQLIATGVILSIYFDVRAIRAKLRLMGFRLADKKEIEDFQNE